MLIIEYGDCATQPVQIVYSELLHQYTEREWNGKLSLWRVSQICTYSSSILLVSTHANRCHQGSISAQVFYFYRFCLLTIFEFSSELGNFNLYEKSKATRDSLKQRGLIFFGQRLKHHYAI